MTVVAGELVDVQFRVNTEELVGSDTLKDMMDGVPKKKIITFKDRLTENSPIWV